MPLLRLGLPSNQTSMHQSVTAAAGVGIAAALAFFSASSFAMRARSSSRFIEATDYGIVLVVILHQDLKFPALKVFHPQA